MWVWGVVCRQQFFAYEVLHDKYTSPISGLRTGVVFMSRQSPGISNVLWGLFERMRLTQGVGLGFFGLQGLLTGKYLDLTEEVGEGRVKKGEGVGMCWGMLCSCVVSCLQDMQSYVNLGGMELLGRSLEHSLMDVDNMEKARATCQV